MPGFIGRKIIFTWNGAAVEGVREKGIALAGEPIDVTDDDSDGWRQLLEEAGENQVNISLSGVTKDQILMKDWFDGTRTRTATLTYPDGRIITGTFFLANYTDTGAYNDATTFECELQSNGEATYTPAA
jgi:predicted secreted protein